MAIRTFPPFGKDSSPTSSLLTLKRPEMSFILSSYNIFIFKPSGRICATSPDFLSTIVDPIKNLVSGSFIRNTRNGRRCQKMTVKYFVIVIVWFVDLIENWFILFLARSMLALIFIFSYTYFINSINKRLKILEQLEIFGGGNSEPSQKFVCISVLLPHRQGIGVQKWRHFCFWEPRTMKWNIAKRKNLRRTIKCCSNAIECARRGTLFYKCPDIAAIAERVLFREMKHAESRWFVIAGERIE